MQANILCNMLNYLQMLALFCIVSSSACIFMLRPPPAYIINSKNIIFQVLNITQNLSARSSAATVLERTRLAVGWVLFLSLVAFMHQIFATFQQFYYLKLLYVKVPIGKYLSNWYLFPLIVSAAESKFYILHA